MSDITGTNDTSELAAKYEFRGNFHRPAAQLAEWGKRVSEPALEPELPIIDAHHHLWNDAHLGRYMIDELMADIDASGHKVLGTVFTEVGTMYRADGPAELMPVGEAEFANGQAAMGASGHYGATRACAGILGHADLTLGDAVRPVLEALIAAGNGRLRGIRHGVCWDVGNAGKYVRRKMPQHAVLDPAFRRGFAQLAPLGLSFESWQFHPQLDDTVDLLRAFPETKVILNHAGGLLLIPPYDKNPREVFDTWRKSIRELAQFPNLSIKLGGLGMFYAGSTFHLRDAPPSSEEVAQAWRPVIETCIEAFGPDRCLMESNFPVDKQTCSYGVLWNAMKRITRNFSPGEKAAMYWGTAARVYRLDIPAA